MNWSIGEWMDGCNGIQWSRQEMMTTPQLYVSSARAHMVFKKPRSCRKWSGTSFITSWIFVRCANLWGLNMLVCNSKNIAIATLIVL